MSVRRGDSTVFEVSMTLHFMPAVWFDDGGIELSQTTFITPNDAKCLCHTPHKLVIIALTRGSCLQKIQSARLQLSCHVLAALLHLDIHDL